MPESETRTCANPHCANTWQTEAEAGPEPEICGLCEIEAAARTQPPGPEEKDQFISPPDGDSSGA